MSEAAKFVPECKQAPQEGGFIAWLWTCTFKQMLLSIFSGAGYLSASVLIRYFFSTPLGLYQPKQI